MSIFFNHLLEKESEILNFSEEENQHIVKALRKKSKDKITVTNGRGLEWIGELEVNNKSAFAKKISSTNYSNSIWRMPLYEKYLNKMNSEVADIANASSDGMGGSITAALFLKEFLSIKQTNWIHIDTYAWNSNYLNTKGGNLQGLFAMMEFVRKNYN